MSAGDRLYELLPAIYRIRDAEQGEPLRALMGILAEQLDLLEADIAGLGEDWFIETCAEWVVPYIGDLLGVRLLHDIESGGVYSQRALVANTISFRRRKGTLAMLEDLARDVTGWRAHAVAFFELLGWTQHMNHIRMELAPNPHPRNPDILNPTAAYRVGTVNLRSMDILDREGAAFDEVSHTVDVRPVGQHEGWHNIRNVGIFLWRLGSYPVTGVHPVASATYADGWHLSPLGHPAPLFINPERKKDEKGLATEANVPGKIRPVGFFEDPEAYYGSSSDHSLALYRGEVVDPGELIPVGDVLCKDLSDWDAPPSGVVAVDVVNGRVAFAAGESPAEGFVSTYHYGFSADIGGGPYDRRETLEKAGSGDFAATVTKSPPSPLPAEWHDTIASAVAAWDPTTSPRAVVTVADDATYDEVLELALGAGEHLIVTADNRNRPTVRLRAAGADLDDPHDLSVLGVGGGVGAEATLTLDGLLVAGGIEIAAGSLGKLEVRHTTLVPGWGLDEEGEPLRPGAASLAVSADNGDLEVVIESSITGALRLPENTAGLTIRDCIVDRPEDEAAPDDPRVALAADDAGEEFGPVTVIERTTVFGETHVKTLTLASESIFTRAVTVERRQAGCVRYSYVDDLVSVTPRRFRCQPDLALETRRKEMEVEILPGAESHLIRSRMRPLFTSDAYGQPGYSQLGHAIAEEVRTGAEDGSEMGAFEHLNQPLREANLRVRLEEYLPFGLAAGRIYVT